LELDTFFATTIAPWSEVALRWDGQISGVDDWLQNGIEVGLEQGNNIVFVKKYIDGVETTINQTPYTLQSNIWYHIKIADLGETIQVYIDGTLVLVASDPFSGGNYLGLFTRPLANTVYFDNFIMQPPPDVAVTNITASPTQIPRGNPVYITVTVENQGGFQESFTVYVYADGLHSLSSPLPNPQPPPPGGYGDEYVLPSQIVFNLLPGDSTTLSFTWDTTGVTPGSYTISAYIPPVTDETDTEDNFLKGPIVGGVYEPNIRTPSKWILDLSIPFVVFDLIIAGIAAIGVFKILISHKPLKPWRLTKKTK